jgi:hypothetical protein
LTSTLGLNKKLSKGVNMKAEIYVLEEDFTTTNQCAWTDLEGKQPYQTKVILKSGAHVLKVAEGRYKSVGAGGEVYVDIPSHILRDLNAIR